MNKRIICVDCSKESKDISHFLNNKIGYFSKCSFCKGSTVFLDPKMVKVFKSFRNKGYNPQYSCEGHISKEGVSSPYLCLKEDISHDQYLEHSNLLIQNFRRGTMLRPSNVKNTKDLDKFIKELIDISNKLPELKSFKKLKYFKPLIVKRNVPKEHFMFVVGKNRSISYFRKNDIKKILRVRDFTHLSQLLNNGPRWIDINSLGSSLFSYTYSPSFKHPLYIVINLKKACEKKGTDYFPESYSDFENHEHFFMTRLILKDSGSHFKLINKNEILPYFR